MATVIAEMSMALDGFVADASDGIDEVFAWFLTGDIEVPTEDPEFTVRATSEASAGQFRDALANAGAMLHGRRTFELANGCGGQHPMGVPAFVVTHSVPDGWPREGSTVHTSSPTGSSRRSSRRRPPPARGWSASAAPTSPSSA
jgi:hypothetical protein